ncbi:MAG: DUF2849 domain-containing protein [Hyphomonadaceae bacterium]
MKAITANRLIDGRPVYRDADGGWTEDILGAFLMEDGEEAESALAEARGEETVVVGAYLISVTAPGAPAQREKLREDIRALGPTVPAGSQAEEG